MGGPARRQSVDELEARMDRVEVEVTSTLRGQVEIVEMELSATLQQRMESAQEELSSTLQRQMAAGATAGVTAAEGAGAAAVEELRGAVEAWRQALGSGLQVLSRRADGLEAQLTQQAGRGAAGGALPEWHFKPFAPDATCVIPLLTHQRCSSAT